jgi:opacity protein-like surface antigen
MKKIILAIAALALIAAPAMAVDWNFYGSARVQTSYHWWDVGNATTNTFVDGFWTTQTGDDAPNFSRDDDDDGLYWDLLGTSRIGARVRGEGVNAGSSSTTASAPGCSGPDGGLARASQSKSDKTGVR